MNNQALYTPLLAICFAIGGIVLMMNIGVEI